MAAKERTHNNARIAFIHGRPGPHPSHATLARSVNADFYFVDEMVRYHDLPNAGRIKRYASWFLNALFMRNAAKYDLIISEGIHFPPVIRKRLGLLKKQQKVPAMMGSETLYFLKINWYPRSSNDSVLRALALYDALICLSRMQADIARSLIVQREATVQVLEAHEAIGKERFEKFGGLSPALEGKRLLFVSNGPSGWRAFYKGIETLIDTFEVVAGMHADATLTIVGEWDEDYVESLFSKLDKGRDKVHFAGGNSDLAAFFQNADLCVHLANGDAFPVATLESLRAGLPVMVSDWTGTKEVIEQIDERLVVPMDPAVASERIDWYFNLPLSDKMEFSNKGREVVGQFSAEKSCAEFQAAVDQILN